MTQGIDEKIGVATTIKSEAHFFKVGSKMLCTDVMPRSAHAPLEQRERIFHGVRMNVPHGVDSLAVIDSLVPCSRYIGSLHCEGVRREIIGENHFNVFADVLPDEVCDCFSLNIVGMKHAKFAIALTNSDDDFLFRASSAAPSGFAALFDSTNVGFVHLKLAVQHRLVHLSHCS